MCPEAMFHVDFLGIYHIPMDLAEVLHEFSTKSSLIFMAYPDHRSDLPKSLPRRDLASPPLPENPTDSCGNLRSQQIVSVFCREVERLAWLQFAERIEKRLPWKCT